MSSHLYQLYMCIISCEKYDLSMTQYLTGRGIPLLHTHTHTNRIYSFTYLPSLPLSLFLPTKHPFTHVVSTQLYVYHRRLFYCLSPFFILYILTSPFIMEFLKTCCTPPHSYPILSYPILDLSMCRGRFFEYIKAQTFNAMCDVLDHRSALKNACQWPAEHRDFFKKRPRVYK